MIKKNMNLAMAGFGRVTGQSPTSDIDWTAGDSNPISPAGFASGRVGLVVTDARGLVTAINRVYAGMTGSSLSAAIGCRFPMRQSSQGATDLGEDWWSAIRASGEWCGELLVRRKDGNLVAHTASVVAVFDDAERISNYVVSLIDVVDLNAMKSTSRHALDRTTASDLPERLLLIERIDQAIDRAKQLGTMFSVLRIHLEGMGVIDDCYGPGSWDYILVQAAGRLRSRIRVTDTLARLNGDEFVVVLEGLALPENAELAANSISVIFEEPFVSRCGQNIYLDASFGISLFPDSSASARDLLQFAGTAVRQAMLEPPRRLRVFAPQLSKAAVRRADTYAHLRKALREKQFSLEFQPIVGPSGSGHIEGAEALVRWNHPTLGALAPSEFLPLAEETGLIVPLGEWVLRAACEQMQQWRSSGLKIERISVNVSPRQFLESNIVELVRNALLETGLPAACLDLEITEVAMLDCGGKAIVKLNELRSLGVSLSVDDFGTGYSSLAYLKALPVSALKIDRSFVRDVPVDSKAVTIVRAIVSLAKSLNLKVIVEGVESDAQFDFLKSLGCDFFQGYLFAPPLSSGELALL